MGKWRDRLLAEGDAGLQDRTWRPHRSPTRTKARLREQVLRLRRRHRLGADQIAYGGRPRTRRSVQGSLPKSQIDELVEPRPISLNANARSPRSCIRSAAGGPEFELR